MTDAALIAIATSGAGVTVVTVGAVFMATWWMRDAKDDAARYLSQLSTATEQLKASAALVSDLTGKLKTANARVESLDAENQKLRAERPVAGADSVLSSESAAAHPGSGIVSHEQPADSARPDGLLKPGE